MKPTTVFRSGFRGRCYSTSCLILVILVFTSFLMRILDSWCLTGVITTRWWLHLNLFPWNYLDFGSLLFKNVTFGVSWIVATSSSIKINFVNSVCLRVCIWFLIYIVCQSTCPRSEPRTNGLLTWLKDFVVVTLHVPSPPLLCFLPATSLWSPLSKRKLDTAAAWIFLYQGKVMPDLNSPSLRGQWSLDLHRGLTNQQTTPRRSSAGRPSELFSPSDHSPSELLPTALVPLTFLQLSNRVKGDQHPCFLSALSDLWAGCPL